LRRASKKSMTQAGETGGTSVKIGRWPTGGIGLEVVVITI
jgi:hypothetical protein